MTLTETFQNVNENTIKNGEKGTTLSKKPSSHSVPFVDNSNLGAFEPSNCGIESNSLVELGIYVCQCCWHCQQTKSNSMKTRLCLIAAVGLFSAFASGVYAATFSLAFEVTSFSSFDGSPAPTDPVLGTIIWEAPSIHDQVESIDSINLTIGGHKYSETEIGSLVRGDGYMMIGGISEGVDMMLGSTDDFWISWNPIQLTPGDFSYTSSLQPGMWYAAGYPPGHFPTFSITEVPEPGASVIICVGLVIGGALGLRKRIHPTPFT